MTRYFMNSHVKQLLLACTMLLMTACSHYSLHEGHANYVSLASHETVSIDKQAQQSQNREQMLLQRFAPIIKIHDAGHAFNRIGTPKVNEAGEVYVDSNEASFFTHTESFQIGDKAYTNLVYRVHFSEIPFSLFPFHLSWGKNVGLIFVVTLDENEQVVLFTTTHTCGCYKALMGTSQTPENAFPDNWDNLDSLQKVYGEELPRRLETSFNKPDICVAVRPQEHRIMDVYACQRDHVEHQQAATYPLTTLRTLKDPQGREVSFFHEDGYQEGFVKGAIKPWETLLMSWLSLDLFIGTDKAYLRKEDSNNTFYTSIKPWNRTKTDMADFPQFLHYWGWKL